MICVSLNISAHNFSRVSEILHCIEFLLIIEVLLDQLELRNILSARKIPFYTGKT